MLFSALIKILKTKLSRKIKLYSSLASFAVLGGIAITAASCAET